MATEDVINEGEQSALERDAHQWRLHQTDHFLHGTPYGQPLTCDLDCPMRASDDDSGE